MPISDLVVLLPCTSLEDLPLEWTPEEAEEILSSYSALWHPALVGSAGSIPRWARAEDPPEGPEGALVVVPGVGESRLPTDWPQKAQSAGLHVIRGFRHRAEIVSAAVGLLENVPAGLCPEVVGDFLALGYAHLLTELVTRQIRYMSNWDEVRFGQEVVAGARAALGGQADLAHEHLRAALDILAEAKQYYYPAEAYLLDLTVVAPSTLGASLRATVQRALEHQEPTNLLLGATELQLLAQQDPDCLALLRQAWSEKKIGIIAGGQDESPLPLLPIEAVREHILQGCQVVEDLLGARPRVFGRRRYALSVILPQLLAGLGLEAVFHGALDEGRFPTSHPSKIRWEAMDGTTIDALARVPLDATRADSFLRIARPLGETLDWDQTNMVILAHWPGPRLCWLEDLYRICRYSNTVAQFLTVEDYLEQTRYGGQQKRYAPDEYRSAYLRQEVARHVPDPISRWVDYYRLRWGWEQLRTLVFLEEALLGRPVESAWLEELRESIRRLAAQEEPFQPEQWLEGRANRQGLEKQIQKYTEQMLLQLFQLLLSSNAHQGAEAPPDSSEPSPTQAPSEAPQPRHAEAVLLLNPASFTRAGYFCLPAEAQPASWEGVRLAGRQQGRLWGACQVPGMGFVCLRWTGPGLQTQPPFPMGVEWPPVAGTNPAEFLPQPAPSPQRFSEKPPEAHAARLDLLPQGRGAEEQAEENGNELIYPTRKPRSWAARLVGKAHRPLPPLAEEHLVRNEFFEARLDPATGALRGIYTYGSRRPRCAQQLAMRIPVGEKAEDSEQNYTIMAADHFRILSAGPVVGQLQVQGRLMTQQGQLAAYFTEIFRCRRGDPVLEILIHLDPQLLPEPQPWNSYYACRFAWADQTCELYRSVHQITLRSEADRLETPWFVHLRTEKERTTLLFGGLCYHRRIGVHKLDTLLIVRGETARNFRLGIGIDLKHPMCAAWDFLAPAVGIGLPAEAQPAPKASFPPAQAWFFHFNVRNVLATGWESVVEEGRVCGFRVRLLETEGRSTNLQLRALRPLATAAQVDLAGNHLQDLPVDQDTIQIPIHAYQYLQVEGRYK